MSLSKENLKKKKEKALKIINRQITEGMEKWMKP